MKLRKKSLGDKFRYYLSWCCEAKNQEERAKKALVVSGSLFVTFLGSIILHNLWYLVFQTEDFVFFFLVMAVGLALPLYFLYTLVVLAVFLARKVFKKVKIVI